MRVYLSAAYSRRDEIHALACALSDAGANIVSTWHQGPAENENTATAHQRGQWAARDLNEVRQCDVFVSVTDGGSSYPGGMRHVEFGVAWISDKRCIRVGPADHIGHDLPGVFVFDSVEGFVEHVQALCAREVGL